MARYGWRRARRAGESGAPALRRRGRSRRAAREVGEETLAEVLFHVLAWPVRLLFRGLGKILDGLDFT